MRCARWGPSWPRLSTVGPDRVDGCTAGRGDGGAVLHAVGAGDLTGNPWGGRYATTHGLTRRYVSPCSRTDGQPGGRRVPTVAVGGAAYWERTSERARGAPDGCVRVRATARTATPITTDITVKPAAKVAACAARPSAREPSPVPAS